MSAEKYWESNHGLVTNKDFIQEFKGEFINYLRIIFKKLASKRVICQIYQLKR